MKLNNSLSAIVTGGTSGLGEGTARMLAAAGVKVGIFDMNEDRGQMVAKEIGGVFVKVNVSDNASVDAGFEAVRAEIGQERIMVNCAGIGGGIKTSRVNAIRAISSRMIRKRSSALSIST